MMSFFKPDWNKTLQKLKSDFSNITLSTLALTLLNLPLVGADTNSSSNSTGSGDQGGLKQGDWITLGAMAGILLVGATCSIGCTLYWNERDPDCLRNVCSSGV